ncbi:MAG: hypothetical protein NVS1B2_22630 [Vulcanimicrobiaceae bacterium]
MTSPQRPGLGSLAYRIGTHGSFFRTMLDRVNVELPPLTTRDTNDPSIALLDGWALIGDVLAFYQERIANEGFLRTATEKRSLVELAKLVGYVPRPGVAASVFLAYTLDKGSDVTLAPGSRIQSVPGPGEMPQTFETSDPLAARDVWNVLGMRKTRPQNPSGKEPFYVSTVTTNLKPNDVLLFVRPGDAAAGVADVVTILHVTSVELQPALNRTKIGAVLTTEPEASATPATVATMPSSAAPSAPLVDRIGQLRERLLSAPTVTPLSPQRLQRQIPEILGANLDLTTQLFGALHPQAADTIYTALANAPTDGALPVEVYAFRVHAAPYGHNAPSKITLDGRSFDPDEWPLAELDEDPRTLSLDARYDRIARGSYVVIRTIASKTASGNEDRRTAVAADNSFTTTFAFARVVATAERARRDYGIAATSTVLRLDADYVSLVEDRNARDSTLEALRNIDVYAQSERLHLAEVPIESDVPTDPEPTADVDAKDEPTMVELDGIYDGLAPGRWAIVAGTRTDAPGVADAELVMIAKAEHLTNPAIPGDALHTFVTFSSKLAFRYDRKTVCIYGNVVRATHGETRHETLGSGDASRPRQSFALKAKPLTFVSSPTQTGTFSTLDVRVNGVRWNLADDPSALGPTDRAFVTTTDDAGTLVTFGDGIHGLRLPTGAENVVATYRSGLGLAGNVGVGKLSLLQSRPLGVKGVLNPKAASGGADSESPSDLRRNLPTALLALDRLVSLDDYEDFARTFAGIARAVVARIGSGGASTVILTLAGPDNAAIDRDGELANNLAMALRSLGDPRQAFELHTCERVVLLIGASVDLEAEARWEVVEPAIRVALARTLGFDATDFGMPAYEGAAIAAIAGVDGVRDVSIDYFAGVTDATLEAVADIVPTPGRPHVPIEPQPARRTGNTVLPAQLVALDSTVRDTVVLRLASGGASV